MNKKTKINGKEAKDGPSVKRTKEQFR